jgi:hypothetical protein
MGEQRKLGKEKRSRLRETAVLRRGRFCRKPQRKAEMRVASCQWRLGVVG